jgi:endoglucanase
MAARRILAAIAACALTAGAANAQAPAGSPVAKNGKLHVCGTQLCNSANQPVQLRGMSTHGLQWFANCINDDSLDALAQDWKADIVRVSMYVQEGGYQTNPERFTRLVNSVVNRVTARGLYVIIDWHMLDPGDPFYNLERAKTFFRSVAATHSNKINVLYEVANEPNGVTWNRIKRYHEAIIPVIRNRDPDAVILLGTRGWSSLGVADGASEQEVIDDPVDATNIMYTFHFYAASDHTVPYNALRRASAVLPMFVTEFGTQTYTGGGANDFAQTQKFIDLMASRKIGWTNWNFSDDPRSGAVFKVGTCPAGPFAGTSALKAAGRWIRAQLRKPDNFPQ